MTSVPGPTLGQILDQATQPETPAITVVRPQADSRLDQLTAQYDRAKAEKDRAEETLKAITDGIKVELATAAPGETSVELASEHLAQPLRLIAVTSWRVDAKKLKAEAPETYVRYAKKSTAWQLRPVSG